VCVEDGEFGNICEESEQEKCGENLLCAKGDVEDEITHCLKDLDVECAANTDCANSLFCLNGKCTCDVGVNTNIFSFTILKRKEFLYFFL